MSVITTDSIDLTALAAAIHAREEHKRMIGRRVVGIAGPIGRIDQHGEMHLRLEALTPRAREAAVEMRDCGLVDVDAASGRLFISRQPVVAEASLLRRALGIERLS